MTELPDVNRLYWQCRRGMLELDCLLQPFLEIRYESLEPEQQQMFIRLLGESDDDLYQWFMDPGSEVPSRYRFLVATIRDS